VIAQCLAAAQHSVPPDFTVHSMHCYFVLAGNAEIPVIYHVEHVREGRSYMTRTVQARQRGRVIFTTTLSFVKEKSGGKKLVEHACEMPFVPGPNEDEDLENDAKLPQGLHSPFQSQKIDILNSKMSSSKTRCEQEFWLTAYLQTTRHSRTQNAHANGSNAAARSRPAAATKRISLRLPTCPTATSSAPYHAFTNSGV
jgi:acyl-CoA thioesterase 8